jgi:hypothetical protein
MGVRVAWVLRRVVLAAGAASLMVAGALASAAGADTALPALPAQTDGGIASAVLSIAPQQQTPYGVQDVVTLHSLDDRGLFAACHLGGVGPSASLVCDKQLIGHLHVNTLTAYGNPECGVYATYPTCLLTVPGIRVVPPYGTATFEGVDGSQVPLGSCGDKPNYYYQHPRFYQNGPEWDIAGYCFTTTSQPGWNVIAFGITGVGSTLPGAPSDTPFTVNGIYPSVGSDVDFVLFGI